jgi:hypothetical protein
MHRFALGRDDGRDDTCSFVTLATEFAASDFNVRELILSTVTQDTFRFRPGGS